MDFDRFKVINDTLGHDVGDQLLCSIAERLRGLEEPAAPHRLRNYRLGGDEFVMLLDGPGVTESFTAFAAAAIEVFAEPHGLGPHRCISTASIGIVASAGRDPDPIGMMRDADLAMFHAKDLGKGRFVVFDNSMYAAAQRRYAIETELRKAVRANTLGLSFQPYFDASSQALQGYEALLRWSHPDFGQVHHQELIDIAAESDLIHELGSWILEAVVHRLHQAADAGQSVPRVSINISRAEAFHPLFTERVAAAIGRHQILRGHLQFEFDESVLGRGREAFEAVLAKVLACGVRVGLDNVGGDHASLRALALLPVAFIKIRFGETEAGGGDRSRQNITVVEAIATFARNRGIWVVGTMIATSDELATAMAIGVDAVQGRLLGEPKIGFDDLPGVEEDGLRLTG